MITPWIQQDYIMTWTNHRHEAMTVLFTFVKIRAGTKLSLYTIDTEIN